MKKLLIILILLMQFSALRATKYYISATGLDSNSGLTTLLPKQTITAVNALSLVAGDSVCFKKGDGWYGTLTASVDSVTYTTYGSGSAPTITGFTTVTGWTNEGGGVYSKVITSESKTNMVTIDGVQYGMGRYPNSDFLTYESASTNVSLTDNTLGDAINWSGAEALIYKNAYRIERTVITNHTSNTLTYSIYSGLNTVASPTNNYFIQNDLRTLDQYGEWYHNTTTGKFYMFFGATVPTTKTVKVATLNNLCKVNTGHINMIIDGLAFNGSIKAAFTAEYNCHNLTIQNSTFNFIGSDGIYIDGESATITNSTFNYCNRTSIIVVNKNATITNNSILNNAVIVGQGNYGYSGTSALVATKDSATVTGNSIQNTGTNGIFIGEDVDVGLVKNNYVYNTCLVNTDHGSIYTANPHTALVIEDNGIIKSGGFGIYADEVSTHVTIQRNTISECNLAGIQLHKGSNCSVLNNTIFNCVYGIKLLSWIANTCLLHDLTITGNIVVAKTATQKVFYLSTLATRFDSIFSTSTFSGNVYARPIDDNTSFYWTVPGNTGDKTLAQWQIFCGKDANSTKSPQAITSESQLQFEYNQTQTIKPVGSTLSKIDLTGKKYSTSTTLLQPNTSLVLIPDSSPFSPANTTGAKKAIKKGLKYYYNAVTRRWYYVQ